MIFEFLKKNTSSRLTLLFAGWGMSASDFRFLENNSSDLLICSDYRQFSFDSEVLSPYTDIRLVAYSLGVWAAAFVFRESNIPFSEKIAINGTHYPVDNERGIPISIYEGTERQLTERSLRKFHFRMCGSKAGGERFVSQTVPKNISNLKEELRTIQKMSALHAVSDFRWGKVIMSANDNIFPIENQRNAWKNYERTEEMDAPHFSEELFRVLHSH